MNNVVFIYGEDSFTALQHLQAIKAKYIEVQTGDLNLCDLDGATISVDELTRQIKTLPFLAKKRLVIVRNTLSSKNKVLSEALPDIAKLTPETTILIVYDTQVD